jgi:hypothetical protein
VDFARCTEVTWGVNGFHPHLHVAIVLRYPLSREQVQELRRIMFEPWCRSVRRAGFRSPSWKQGVHCINVRSGAGDAAALADYVTKIEGLSHELTRLDRKSAGKSSFSPFQILEMASRGIHLAVGGVLWDLAGVWHQYEVGTKGRRALTYSQTWRERVSDVAEPTDEALSGPEGDIGEWVGMLANDEAKALSLVPNGHEVFMELLGDESPEAFLKATEWLCLELEDIRWDDERFPDFSTKRAEFLFDARDKAAIAEEILEFEASQPQQEVLF